VYRLVMAAGANRDFNPIHHNTEIAQASGAPEMYANTLLLQGMWERTARQYIGLAGVIRRLAGFQMRIFNTVGDTVVVKGSVERKWSADDLGFVELGMWSENSRGTSVGPGRIVATLPMRSCEAG
jgi:acyl dehydratase